MPGDSLAAVGSVAQDLERSIQVYTDLTPGSVDSSRELGPTDGDIAGPLTATIFEGYRAELSVCSAGRRLDRMSKTPIGETAPSIVERPARRPGKEAILRAAIEVMGELGYEGASTRDMAARAGVSVAALYHHFPSKLDLLREFLGEAYDITISRLLRRMAAADPSPRAQLDEFVATMMASYLHNDFARLAANVASHEYTRLEPPDRASIDKKRRRVLRILTDVLEEGVRSGDFDVSEPKEAARAIIALAVSPLASFTEMRKSMASVIRLYQGFARGIATSG